MAFSIMRVFLDEVESPDCAVHYTNSLSAGLNFSRFELVNTSMLDIQDGVVSRSRCALLGRKQMNACVRRHDRDIATVHDAVVILPRLPV